MILSRFSFAISFSVISFIPTLCDAQNKALRATPVPGADGLIKRSGVIPNTIPAEETTNTDPDSAKWERNPHKAFAQAKSNQKPMLLLFTAQQNTICQNLSSEVFSSKTFNRYAKENLVICYLDYPRDPLDTPDELRRMKEKFKVRGLPVLLFFDPEGHVIQQITGYHTGRPVDYFKNLKAITDKQITEIAEKRKLLVRQGYREWSNNKGQKFFALFVQRDESSITLKSSSGEKWKIDMNKLSDADQQFAQSFPVFAPKK